MLALLLALAVSRNPPQPPPQVDPRLVGCYRSFQDSSQVNSNFSSRTTLCLFPDGSATEDSLTTFLSFVGPGVQSKEERAGRWSLRGRTLAFDHEEGRDTWRVRLLEDGLELDGQAYERVPMPEPEETEADPEEEAPEIDPAILEALRARIQEALLQYLAAQRAASGG